MSILAVRLASNADRSPFDAGLPKPERSFRRPADETLMLRELQVDDLHRLEQLTQRCGEPERGWTLRTLSRSLADWPSADDRVVVGGFDGSGPSAVLLGVAALAPDLGQWGDADVAVLVAPEFRGRGVGRRLLRAIIAVADERGYGAVSARVTAGNAAFLHLAERVGLWREESVGAEPLLLWGAARDHGRRATRVRMS